MSGQLIAQGVPLHGICLYPILGMPEWHARDQWALMGLWDLEREGDLLHRRPCSPGLLALQAAQRAVPPRRGPRKPRA